MEKKGRGVGGGQEVNLQTTHRKSFPTLIFTCFQPSIIVSSFL